ncbi:MAG: O-antigen ligase family protein [Saprospiraceae bacterium]|nr:O-antigen ligase family protein [Saprospiraceae bacterium]
MAKAVVEPNEGLFGTKQDNSLDKWITGYGAGGWKLVFPSKSIEGSYRLQSQNIMFTRAHNDFLEIWAELGITGI